MLAVHRVSSLEWCAGLTCPQISRTWCSLMQSLPPFFVCGLGGDSAHQLCTFALNMHYSCVICTRRSQIRPAAAAQAVWQFRDERGGYAEQGRVCKCKTHAAHTTTPSLQTCMLCMRPHVVWMLLLLHSPSLLLWVTYCHPMPSMQGVVSHQKAEMPCFAVELEQDIARLEEEASRYGLPACAMHTHTTTHQR